MAWTNSKVFGAYLEDLAKQTFAHNLTADTIYAALYGNAITPDNTVSSANSAYNAGQWVTGGEKTDSTRWPAGGIALTTKAATRTGASTAFTADNPASAAGTTMADVYGALVYNSTRSSRGLSYNYFGGPGSCSNGVFTVVWATGGIFTLAG